MTFKKFVDDWWLNYIDDHNTEEDDWDLNEIFTQMGYSHEEHLDEKEGITVESFLMGLDADDVYEFFFGYGAKAESNINDIPSTEDFLIDMYREALNEIGYSKYEFADDFVLDMASESIQYTHPENFFDDLNKSGCQSGMIGMLIYHDDCKRIYVRNIDDMESFVEELEEEIGEPIKNSQHQPHYTFVCWLCYEEIGYRIAQELFPDSF